MKGFTPKSATFITDALGEKDDEADIVVDCQGHKQADSNLRDDEKVPLKEELDDCSAQEIEPDLPNAWIDEDNA